MIKTLSGCKASQKPKEINRLKSIIKEESCDSYLEIGARDGDTFYDVVTSCFKKSSTVVAVDLPGGAWGAMRSKNNLENAVNKLKSLGYHNVHLIFGDSTSSEVIDKIKSISDRYDCALIDGDHRYDGVKLDFNNYSKICNKLVAFHDIDGDGVIQKTSGYAVEVPVLWNEVKHDYKHEEIISDEEPHRPMGIGVLWV